MSVDNIFFLFLWRINFYFKYFQERPEKPDKPWITTAQWNNACDIEDLFPHCFTGLKRDLTATPCWVQLGDIKVSLYIVLFVLNITVSYFFIKVGLSYMQMLIICIYIM